MFKQIKKISIAVFVIVLCVVIASCKKKKEQKEILSADCGKVTATYAAIIQPITNGNCLGSGCHGAGSGNGDFTSFAGLKIKADNGILFRRVVKDGSMPPSGSLSKDDRIKFKCWIENGALNN